MRYYYPTLIVKRFLIGVVTLVTSLSASAADFVAMPTDLTVNASGTEAFIEVEADFGGGEVETATIHIQGNRFSITASGGLPIADNQLLMTFPPCIPNPATGLCEFDPLAPPPTPVYIPASSTNGGVGVLVPIGVCAVGYAVAYGFNGYACRHNGGIQSQEIGACGMFGGSSVVCNDPDTTPPDEPEIPDEPDPPTPPSPPPGTPPACTSGGCGDFWNWNRGALSGCLSMNPEACY